MSKTITAKEIHEEFQQAFKASTLPVKELVQSDDKTHDFLKSVGLTNSKTFQKILPNVQRNSEAKSENAIVESLKAYETRYPKYRMISLKKVVALMEKYNLVFGSLAFYIDEIPQENIKELKKYGETTVHNYKVNNNFLEKVKDDSSPYFIVAPLKFFKPGLTIVDRFLLNLEKPKMSYEMDLNAFKVEFNDPIVLKDLYIDYAGGSEIFCHICTAWDVEAGDADVTNQIPKQITNN